MYDIFDWHRYDRLLFALSVPFRTESVCILLTICILRYILLLDVLIGIMPCFYSLFNQHIDDAR